MTERRADMEEDVDILVGVVVVVGVVEQTSES
jgi:hypothetical protein